MPQMYEIMFCKRFDWLDAYGGSYDILIAPVYTGYSLKYEIEALPENLKPIWWKVILLNMSGVQFSIACQRGYVYAPTIYKSQLKIGHQLYFPTIDRTFRVVGDDGLCLCLLEIGSV